MIRGSPCRLRIDPAKIERTEIKLVNKHVNYANRVVLVDPIIQAFGNNVDCPRSTPSTKRFIATSPENRVRIVSCGAFSHSLGRRTKPLSR